ncbi:MAG: hypothetical protein IJ766_05940 [Clostridia bacterium]|nr:hypothetical protein [Clostridia bacterium]
MRELDRCALIERSITKKYRKELWNPFIGAVKRYRLIEENAVIAVPLDGSAEAFLAAKLLQMLQRNTEIPFFLIYFPSAKEPSILSAITDIALILHIPLSAPAAQSEPYTLVQSVTMDTVIAATVADLLYCGKLQAVLPRETRDGVRRIRPLYAIQTANIEKWRRYNELSFPVRHTPDPQRQAARELIDRLKQNDPDIERNIFHSIHAVCMDTFPGYQTAEERHTFLEKY